MVEPGRSIAAVAGITLYRVGTVKAIPDCRTYVAVDGGMPVRSATVRQRVARLSVVRRAHRFGESVDDAAGGPKPLGLNCAKRSGIRGRIENRRPRQIVNGAVVAQPPTCHRCLPETWPCLANS